MSATTNPHPPMQGDETVTCAGCGHDVSVNDDTMAWDDRDAPDGFRVAHVDCESRERPASREGVGPMATVTDPLAAYRQEDGSLEAWAWPGGYPIYYLTRDGLTVCPPCASRETDDTQAAIAADVNWEDPDLYCDDCNERIESAYAEED